MKTPICDFVEKYISAKGVRMHMPGHKGKCHLGFEKYDITEIAGADSLYHAQGIIKESEENATSLFESGATLYSTEGSSHVIRAMLYLAKVYSGKSDGYVLAGRNAHSSFISACALNGLDVEWLCPQKSQSYLSSVITEAELEGALAGVKKAPVCVYITSPDYLGNMCDVAALASVCEKYGTMLLVDNAHGAYLKFLEQDLHPITNGALMCADSAHKTLPVLTGGAYLHISKNAPDFFKENAKAALGLFGSTSPSYLTLASLDNANKYISQDFGKRLQEFASELEKQVSSFSLYPLIPKTPFQHEPLKIVIEPNKIGYRGEDFNKILESNGIVCEFFDDDYLVLMPSLENTKEEMEHLFKALSQIEIKQELQKEPLPLVPPKKRMSIREATYAPREKISIDLALGRILAMSCVSCPPAVSLIVCGEEFNQSTINLCKKYGLEYCYVVK